MPSACDGLWFVPIFLTFLGNSFGQIVPSCTYGNCRYVVYREAQDNGNIVVNDASVHAITWAWEVQGGRWNVTYHYVYPSGWYEGKATFLSCRRDGREQAYVAWGSSKPWSSNAIPIRANAWNISYNGDIFGFVPMENGKYIFRIYSRNKAHNPFSNGEIISPPGSCHFSSSDKYQIKSFWSDRKRYRDCEEPSFNWSWMGNNGRWHVDYRWNMRTGQIICNVYYAASGRPENLIISWEIGSAGNAVMRKSNTIKIYNEPAWSMNLNPDENWGFSPVGQGNWIFRHFSRNSVFQPFMNQE